MDTRLVWIVMGLALLLVGGRTLLAAQSALSPDLQQEGKSANRRQDTLVYEATRSDSLIRSISGLPRSPFMAPPARLAQVAQKRKANELPPAPVVPPRALLLMEDGNSTVVQIEVDGETSGRMSIGNSFRGWTITAINERGIVVSNGSSTFNLPRP